MSRNIIFIGNFIHANSLNEIIITTGFLKVENGKVLL